MNEWINRAKQRMKELKLTHQEVADHLGVVRASVTHYLSGRREPSLNQLIEWATLLKTTPSWLQFGIDNPAAALKDSNFNPTPPTSSYLPVISWPDASRWEQLADKHQKSKDTKWIPYAGNTINNAFALQIQGDSMEALHGISFIENSYIIVAPHRIAKHEDFVIVQLKNKETTLLRQLILEGKKQILKPLNPRYSMIEMKRSIAIYGVVCQAFQTF